MAKRPEPGGGRPLLVSADPGLLDDLLRLTSVAGAEAEVADEPELALRSWPSAPLVLVGTELAARTAELVTNGSLPRRGDVVLVGTDLDDAGVWQQAVEIGAERVAILPDAEGWLLDRMARAGEGPGSAGTVVTVVGGRGGAGATVFATALALAGSRAGIASMLVDADPLGGGIDLVLGAEDQAGLRWPALRGLRGHLPADTLAAALPAVAELTVLSWDRDDPLAVPAAAMTALLAAGRHAHPWVVVDLPRTADPAADVALAQSDATLLVVPAEVRACAAAGRVVAAIGSGCRDLRVVVRGPAPGGLSAELVAEALGLPLAGWLRPEPGLADALERGEPPGRGRGPLARLSDRLVAQLAPGPALSR